MTPLWLGLAVDRFLLRRRKMEFKGLWIDVVVGVMMQMSCTDFEEMRMIVCRDGPFRCMSRVLLGLIML